MRAQGFVAGVLLAQDGLYRIHQLLQPALLLPWRWGIEAHVPPWGGVAPFGGQAHQQGPIADVVAQGTGDAALQEGLRALSSAAGGRPHQLQAGLLAQIVQLHQVAVAAAEAAGDAIGQEEVLLDKGVTATLQAGRWRSGAASKADAATATASTTRPN